MPSLKSSIGNTNHISLDDVCFLMTVTTTEDELGQPINTEVERQVFCSKLNVSRAEFFSAGQLDLKPQIVIVVDSDEYDLEKRVKYDNKTYTVYRHFMRPDGHTELYCEVRANG
jgi:SPP1 family predicted phage head-tail adaptor